MQRKTSPRRAFDCRERPGKFLRNVCLFWKNSTTKRLHQWVFSRWPRSFIQGRLPPLYTSATYHTYIRFSVTSFNQEGFSNVQLQGCHFNIQKTVRNPETNNSGFQFQHIWPLVSITNREPPEWLNPSAKSIDFRDFSSSLRNRIQYMNSSWSRHHPLKKIKRCLDHNEIWSANLVLVGADWILGASWPNISEANSLLNFPEDVSFTYLQFSFKHQPFQFSTTPRFQSPGFLWSHLCVEFGDPNPPKPSNIFRTSQCWVVVESTRLKNMLQSNWISFPQSSGVKIVKHISQEATTKAKLVFHPLILLIEDILHHLIGRFSHYLRGFIIHPRWFAGFLPSTVSTNQLNPT